jgi:hypothetical protein
MGMQPLDDDEMAEFQATHVPHVRRLREVIWKPRKDREKRCARCTLAKRQIVTLVMAGEQFGLCDRCLETLWNLAFHDE